MQNFREPFFFVIHEGKERVQKRLQVPDEEFAKVLLYVWNFKLLNLGEIFACLRLIFYFMQWAVEIRIPFI